MEYVGCFKDDGNRDLQEGPRNYGYTSESCKQACSNYDYFALQNGGWCVCGNEYSTEAKYSQVGDGDCGAVCAGEAGMSPSRFCGGAWRNAIYGTKDPEPAAPPPAAPAAPAMKYIGCFKDDGNRDLQEGPMNYGYTSESCKQACSNYDYFALQNGGWCVCGNEYSTEAQYSQVGDGECGAVCAGEGDLSPDRYCGAGWRNAVYGVKDDEAAAVADPHMQATGGSHQDLCCHKGNCAPCSAALTQASSQKHVLQLESTGPMDYVGCFKDDGNRDLQEGPRNYGYTSESCKQACSNYDYFALQNGGWCVCGNEYSTEAKYSQVGDGDCGAVCAGEAGMSPSRFCGGAWRNAIYGTKDPEPAAPPPAAPAAPAMKYIGCFKDDGNRDLQEGPMNYGYTSESCKQACSNYDYFALQNGGWCVCGNEYSTEAQYSQVGDGECGAVCAGEGDLSPDRYCGAGWRNAVYGVKDDEAAAVADPHMQATGGSNKDLCCHKGNCGPCPGSYYQATPKKHLG